MRNHNFNSADLRGSKRIETSRAYPEANRHILSTTSQGMDFLESVYEQAFSVALAESGVFSSAKLRCQCFSTGRRLVISAPTC